MATKVRVAGSAYRTIRMDSESLPREVTVVFAEGEDLTVGDLYGRASSGGTTVALDPVDVTGSDGIVTLSMTLDPLDFESYGQRSWQVEIGTLEESSGGDTEYVLFSGLLSFTAAIPNVIASTTVEEVGSS